MRRMNLILAGAMAGLLSACATPPARLASPPTTAAPAPIPGYDWFFHAEADEGRLAYGVAESDDLKLGFSCARNGGELEIVVLAPPGGRREIRLESGGETQRWPAKSEPSHMTEEDMLTAMAASASPVFLRFRQSKWIALWREDVREAYAAHRGSEDGVERFFAFCG